MKKRNKKIVARVATIKKYCARHKYKLASIIILLSTIFLYKAADLIILAQESIKKFDVYTREVKSIPVLRENVGELVEKSSITDDEYGNLISNSSTDSATNKNLNPFDINNLSSKAVYIEDVDTATKLFEKNGDRLLLPASTTKIMTAIVSRNIFELDNILTIENVAEVEGFSVGLFSGEQMKVENLLKAALIQSSNDAAYVLASNHPDGIEGFVNEMNKKAREIGLTSTEFENPAGFDAENHRSSAHDLAILSKEFMKDDFLRGIVGVKKDVITDSTGKYEHYLYNTHQLLGKDETVVGIKTGTTDGASQVLITQFYRDNKNILVIVMGSDDRYEETSNLIDWVFNNYVWLTPEQIVEKS